ncbi:MAG: alpha-glucan family phosphorylase, partial [Candidatus Dormibacteraeota bacterium]|nr:alpha-glucan family phosphorylase [Candidatus Dormibacteraeota bacterium]
MTREVRRLALDLTWTWEPRIQRLFQALDPGIWDETSHNPMAVLRALGDAGVEQALQRDDVRRALDEALDAQREQQARKPHLLPAVDMPPIAYFSLEFGLTDSLPIYSGGLGILAGDHLKAASDLQLPLVGVGLFYKQGFGRQRINENGEQVEQYLYNHPQLLPLELVRVDGVPLQVEAPIGEQTVQAKVWKVKVGRVPLYLLDTDIEANSPDLRSICDRLYVADPGMRLRQEMVLGIGGVRALRALGVEPGVCHLNEGHSFLAAIESAAAGLREAHGTLSERVAAAGVPTVFTTHTPVAAGSDYFAPGLVADLLGPYLESLAVAVDEFVDFGRLEGGEHPDELCTTVVGLREAQRVVGVSRLHGAVSRNLWQGVWPGIPEAEVPIGAITNGVHMPTWLAPTIAELLAEYVHPRWSDLDPGDERWAGVAGIPDEELWSVHQTLRRRLVVLAQVRSNSTGMMRPDILTIGFSRRFAQYKRANLVLSQPDRLRALAGAAGREVQFIFAGKAHPADGGGKDILRDIVGFSRGEPSVSFVEDYNMDIARILVQGADVWLNNPRRPLEASGTSGMKSAMNGGLNLSILDGWWCEGFSCDTGWAFGEIDPPGTMEEQDASDAEALFRTLEDEVLPLYYDRGEDGVPHEWMRMSKTAICRLGWQFETGRMVREYAERY